MEVDGCKGDLEIVEISSRLVPCGLVFLLLENGETYEIDPTEGLQFPNQTDTVVPEAAGGQIAAMNGQLPTSVEAKIHVRYDPSFRDLYGSDSAAKRKIRDIITLVQEGEEPGHEHRDQSGHHSVLPQSPISIA